MMTEPLTHLTHRDMPWKFGEEQQAAFPASQDNTLQGYNSSTQRPTPGDIGISCDASNVGIGTVLFYCYPDGKQASYCQRIKDTITYSMQV